MDDFGFCPICDNELEVLYDKHWGCFYSQCDVCGYDQYPDPIEKIFKKDCKKRANLRARRKEWRENHG